MDADSSGQVGTPSSVPIPDPTELTTAAIDRTARAERDYVNGQLDIIRQRLDGIDKATELLNEQVTQVPTDVDKQVEHLKELQGEKFGSIAQRFAERDTRSERESRDNKVAVDAAFAAQKEAASEQNKSNTLAISKSETATAETIAKLDRLFDTSVKALGDKIDDLKERVGGVEKVANGAGQRSAGIQQAWGWLVAAIGLVGGVIAIAITLRPR